MSGNGGAGMCILHLALGTAFAEWAVTTLVSRTMGATPNMLQKVACQRSNDPMANSIYTGLVAAAGAGICMYGLRTVKMNSYDQ
jgi:hypothetical protein